MKDDTISRAAAVETVKKHYRGFDNDLLEVIAYEMEELPPEQPGCEDTVPRTSVEYICRKNTVSTNPYEHKYHDKFIQFIDDPEISDYGRWQHSNGFNTALVAVQCDLDRVPSVTPKQPEPMMLHVNCDLSKEEYEKLMNDLGKQSVMLLPQEKEQRWIPCKTALPEKGKYVLCQCRAGIMDVFRLTDDNDWYKDSTHIYMHGFVLAWMSLPKPWEGGEE